VQRWRREGIPTPDLSSLRHVKQPQRIQPRLTGSEFYALEQALGSRLLRRRAPRFLVARDTAIIQVLVETGLRAAEMCALDVGDLNYGEGTIHVRRGKGAKDRILSIVDPDPDETDGGAVLRALADYLAHREKLPGALLEPALWLSTKGNRLDPGALRAMLGHLCREAGIRGNRPPHAFRRAWFSASYQADPNSLPVLSARMGWTACFNTGRVLSLNR
jgi:integrase/recombinase XerD